MGDTIATLFLIMFFHTHAKVVKRIGDMKLRRIFASRKMRDVKYAMDSLRPLPATENVKYIAHWFRAHESHVRAVPFL